MNLSIDIRHRLGDLALSVQFEAPTGVIALFGRSGAGKTSVVNAVAGLLRPDAGRIAVADRVLFDAGAGVNLPVHQRRIGYVFQDARLFPHLRVRDNLLYGAPDARDLGRICDLLGVEHLLARRPRALSGGEKARVAIGRALLSSPQLLIMDEPLASLDMARKAEILPYLERLRDEAELPILYVSHSMEEVARLANTMVVLDAGQVLRAGPAAQVLADPGLARHLGPQGAGAVLTGHILTHHADGLTEVAVAGGTLFLPRASGEPEQVLRIRIEAKDVMIALDRPDGISALNILPGIVSDVRPGQGPGAMVQLDIAGAPVLARVTQRSVAALGLAPGLACHAVIKSVSVATQDVGQRGGGIASATLRRDHAPGG